VEFDADLILQDGKRVFSSVSQNWPTAELIPGNRLAPPARPRQEGRGRACRSERADGSSIRVPPRGAPTAGCSTWRASAPAAARA
jgi:hypothetical protein